MLGSFGYGYNCISVYCHGKSQYIYDLIHARIVSEEDSSDER